MVDTKFFCNTFPTSIWVNIVTLYAKLIGTTKSVHLKSINVLTSLQNIKIWQKLIKQVMTPILKGNFLGLTVFLYSQRLMLDKYILEHEMGIFESTNEFYIQGSYIYPNWCQKSITKKFRIHHYKLVIQPTHGNSMAFMALKNQTI